MTAQSTNPALVGWREWVSLPDFRVDRIKAKIDTGARTSVIHAWNIQLDESGDRPWVVFELHPLQRDNETVVPCRAPLVDTRAIKNSGGFIERRCVVRTRLSLGGSAWPIDLSLTNRDAMGFRMLIGRAAIEGRATVDPGRSFILGRRPRRDSQAVAR